MPSALRGKRLATAPLTYGDTDPFDDVRFRPIAAIHALVQPSSMKLVLPRPLLFLALASCQTSSVAPRSSPVFADPAAYVGKQVTVCGRLSGTANIYEERGDRGLSISPIAEGLKPKFARFRQHGRVCLSGEVSYVGCQSDPRIICTDWAFDYALKFTDIRKLG